MIMKKILKKNSKFLADNLKEYGAFKSIVVPRLPGTGEQDTIYMVRRDDVGSNMYDEYLWTNNAWEKIGSTTASASGVFDTDENDYLIIT